MAKKQVNVWMSLEVCEQLDKAAEKMERTRAYVINLAVKQWLNRRASRGGSATRSDEGASIEEPPKRDTRKRPVTTNRAKSPGETKRYEDSERPLADYAEKMPEGIIAPKDLARALRQVNRTEKRGKHGS